MVKLFSDDFDTTMSVVFDIPSGLQAFPPILEFNKNDYDQWKTTKIQALIEGEYEFKITSRDYGEADQTLEVCVIPPLLQDAIKLPLARVRLQPQIKERRRVTGQIRLVRQPKSIGLKDCLVDIEPYEENLVFSQRQWQFNNRNWNRWQKFTVRAKRDDNFVDDVYELKFITMFLTVPPNPAGYERAVLNRKLTVLDTSTITFDVDWIDTAAVGMRPVNEGEQNQVGPMGTDIDMWENGTPQPVSISSAQDIENLEAIVSVQGEHVDLQDPNDSSILKKTITIKL